MKIDGRTFSHDVLESYRFTAISLHKKGISVSIIASSFKVTVQAIYKWLKIERQFGKNALKSKKATGRPTQLTVKQLKCLKKLLRKPATKLGYGTDLWSGMRVRHLIKHQFGIEYHPKHMARFLRRLGLTLKFPQRRALEQDPKEVRLWKKKRLPEIIEYSRKKRALLFYADETLISLIPYVGKTWTFPNVKPIARVSGRRGQHIGISAAVNQQGRMCFELTKEGEKFTAKTFIRFVKKLKLGNKYRNIVLIIDGAPTHTAKIVKEFAEKNKLWLRMEILPAYSPELNPTEKGWCYVKTKKMNASVSANKKELTHNARMSMRALKNNPRKIISFFT